MNRSLITTAAGGYKLHHSTDFGVSKPLESGLSVIDYDLQVSGVQCVYTFLPSRRCCQSPLAVWRCIVGSRPRFSLIIPVRNEAAQIERRLRELQALREQGFEVLVVDGDSSDQSMALAGPLVDKLLAAKPGRAAQMNVGAEAASGDWLIFLHLDTGLPGQAAQLLTQIANQERSLWGWFDVRLDNTRWPYRLIAASMNLRARITRVCTGDQTLFVRRDFFWAQQGFPDLPLMEDVAISKRLRARARPTVLRPPVTTSSRRWEQNGVLATILLMWRLRFLYFLGVGPERLARYYYPDMAPRTEESR